MSLQNFNALLVEFLKFFIPWIQFGNQVVKFFWITDLISLGRFQFWEIVGHITLVDASIMAFFS